MNFDEDKNSLFAYKVDEPPQKECRSPFAVIGGGPRYRCIAFVLTVSRCAVISILAAYAGIFIFFLFGSFLMIFFDVFCVFCVLITRKKSFSFESRANHFLVMLQYNIK